MRLIDAAEVHANLTYEVCIPAIRAAKRPPPTIA